MTNDFMVDKRTTMNCFSNLRNVEVSQGLVGSFDKPKGKYRKGNH